MLGVSLTAVGEVGVFADASAPPSRRPGMRSRSSCHGIPVFQVDDVLLPYSGVSCLTYAAYLWATGSSAPN